jgi:hypothetical protein
VGMFAIVVGVAMLLIGIGFLVLVSGLLGSIGLARRPDLPQTPAPVAS